GDGRDHNSGAHDTGGNINGGPTGIGGGGTNSGDGWHIDKDGSLHIDITEGNQTKPGPGKEGNGNGGDGSNSGSSNSVTVLGNSGYVNMAHAGVPAALYPVSGVLTISLNWSAITAAVREAIIGLDAYLGDVLTRVAPYAGRFLGIVIGSLWPSQIAPDPQLTYNLKDPQVDKDNPYSVIALPA
ncbi:colicin-like bacteriocin tRNase domain-containing protein, partial [Staphylococcus aureus]|nr:colicin-like bacteriocin tRNase domain-containing protein [Staphylococcus aureus]